MDGLHRLAHSLVTALIALRNTLTGPRPFLSPLAGDAVTLLRSDQFVLAPGRDPGVVLRDETGVHADFPLLDLQITLANRAAPPNSVGVRAVESDLVFSKHGKTLFRSPYMWYRTAESSSAPDPVTGTDRLSFERVAQTAPFDLAGGSTWSREVLLIPRQSWAAVDWHSFDEAVGKTCPTPSPLQAELCQGDLTLRVRLDNGVSLSITVAHFADL
ncbi:MAG: hypothetical protein WDN69_27265 [Aliidongia sp.]